MTVSHSCFQTLHKRDLVASRCCNSYFDSLFMSSAWQSLYSSMVICLYKEGATISSRLLYDTHTNIRMHSLSLSLSHIRGYIQCNPKNMVTNTPCQYYAYKCRSNSHALSSPPVIHSSPTCFCASSRFLWYLAMVEMLVPWTFSTKFFRNCASPSKFGSSSLRYLFLLLKWDKDSSYVANTWVYLQ